MRDLAQAREQRSRVDILIHAFAAPDARTGLTNRLSFDSQLALQLEDNQDVGAHGVVLLIMRPDPKRLAERLGPAHAAAIDGALINLVSVSVKRYTDAFLAHYFFSRRFSGTVAALFAERSGIPHLPAAGRPGHPAATIYCTLG